MLKVFVGINHNYTVSPEFQLALSLFQQALPPEAVLTLIDSDHDTFNAHLARIAAKDLVLFVHQAWLFLGNNSVQAMVEVLNNSRQFDCVIPSDTSGYRPQAGAIDYQTLYGFEQFVARLHDVKQMFAPYDQRDVFMVLVRAQVLASFDLTQLDVFQLPKLLPQKTAIALNAYAHEPVDYYSENRQEIIDLIPADLHSLLDIGCANGGFGYHVKQQRGYRVIGVDLNARAASKAHQLLDKVIVADALQLSLSEKVDCVTCLDSLEHFAEPEKLLQRIYHEFLNECGYLVLSLPNVGHWSIVTDLIAGRWDYVPIGLLCNTHMRFFTFHSMKNLLNTHGFELIKVNKFTVAPNENAQALLTCLQQAALHVDHDNLSTVNYHVLAQKKRRQ